MYTYEKDILPLITDPDTEDNKTAIKNLLTEAVDAFQKIDGTAPGIQAIIDNPFNPPLAGMGIYSFARSLITSHANCLWAAASLMLAIPALCTEDNVTLSLNYLEKSGEHGWRFAYMRLGYVYSEGIADIIKPNMTQALAYFEKAHPDANANFNAKGWCYEALGMFYTAKTQYEKTLASKTWDAAPQEKAKRHIGLCLDRLDALHTMGLHAPDSPRNEEKAVKEDSAVHKNKRICKEFKS